MSSTTPSQSASLTENADSSSAVEKHSFSSQLVVVDAGSGVDVAVGLLAGHADDVQIGKDEAKRLRRKLDWHILPLLYMLYTVQFVDKSTLGASAVLGIIPDNHLTSAEFNTLGSAFYIGFLVFEYPQNWALQRFPVGKWLTFNIFLWALFIGLHPLCKSFGSLFVLRFLLGASEGSITAGLMLVTSMFYNRTEIAERIGWTFQCNGIATILSGFISFGVAHISPKQKPNQWQWLMIIMALWTLIIGVLFFLYFPDNPTTARFLTEEEKVKVVKRIQENQNGIETKKWKRSQFIEALTDRKTWLFFLFAVFSDLQNGLGTQYSLIIKAYGFTTLQTTLLNIPSGVTQIMGITLACFILRLYPNSRGWIAIAFWVPSIIADILSLALPITNKGGLLAAIYLLNFGGAPAFVLCLSWVTSSVAGHTKKLTTNAVFLIGYALGQILCTQFWLDKYKPRNHVPWTILIVLHFVDIALLLAIRSSFAAENKRRDVLKEGGQDQDTFGYVDSVDEKGNHVRQRVEKALLDVTDTENLAFRYPL